MADKKYTILAIDFAVNYSADSETTRTAKLIANVSFKYQGLDINDQYGVVVVDLADIDTVTINDGECTAIQVEEFNLDTATVISKAEEAIETKMMTAQIMALDKSTTEQFLAKAKSLEGLPTPYSETGFEQLGI